MIEVVTRSGAPLLQRADVFDVYRDPTRLGEGNVSLALRLTYRAADRTLTDTEVAAVRNTVTKALGDGSAGGSGMPSVSVLGAAGFTGALTARLLDRHPSLELSAVTARSDVGRAPR